MSSSELRDKIMSDLIRHEGVVYSIYLDSEGLPTFGIGHLVTKDDKEYGWDVGTPVGDDRVIEAFSKDLEVAEQECKLLFPSLRSYPDEVQCILVNMTFNLGRPRLSKFKKMIAAVEAEDWNTAADEMMDSRWYRQVKTRGVELVKRMRDVA